MMKKLHILLLSSMLLISFQTDSFARFDPSWNWKIKKTEKFTIYYPEGYEAFAQRILNLSDEIYNDITGYLGTTPRNCPIVINPGTDIFNGTYHPFPNRITLFETPMYSVKGFGPASDLVDLVFTHEYSHFVHVTTKLGWYGNITDVIGDGLAISNILSPGWVIEGITTNTETMFTDGGRGRSADFLGQMMSFAEGEGLWDLSAAGISPPYSPPGGRIYLAGYHMVDYLNRNYGKDAFARLSMYQAKHPIGGTREAVYHVTGKSPKVFYKEFLQDYYGKVNRHKETIDQEKLPKGKVILADGLNGFNNYYWTDKGTIKAVRTGYDKKNAIVEADPVTGKILSETATGKLNNISTIRDINGTSLIYGEYFARPFAEGELLETDLVEFISEKKKHIRITRGEHIYSASLSPDGKRYVAARRNGMWIDLILMNRDGKNIRTLISKEGYYFDNPVWSPDGTEILAVAKVGRNSDIVTINPENGTLKPLFKTDAHEDNYPSYSRDGRWILFSSGRSGIWNIHAWDRTKRKLYRLTSVYYSASSPSLSPDGRTLAFLTMHRGVNRLAIIPFEPEKGKEVKVLNGDGLLKPDLNRIAPEVAFEGEDFPILSNYKPFMHVPYLSADEDGTVIGVSIMGADPVGINSYLGNFFYGISSLRPGVDFTLTNRSFWPTLNARIYDTSEESNYIAGIDDEWRREYGVDLYTGITTIHSLAPSTITSTLIAGAKSRKFEGLEGYAYPSGFDTSNSFYGEIQISRSPDKAQRDVLPIWGQSVLATHEESFSEAGGDFSGHNNIFVAKQYLPSPVKHHGIELAYAWQKQEGDLIYSKDLTVPRGYSNDDSEGGFNLSRNMTGSIEYHFPIWFADRGIGLVLFHMNLLKGSFFADYGAGWNRDFDFQDWSKDGRTTVGTTLTSESNIMSVIPVDISVALGYKVEDEEVFARFNFAVTF